MAKDTDTPTDEPSDDKIQSLERRVAELEAMTEVDSDDDGGGLSLPDLLELGLTRRQALMAIALVGAGYALGPAVTKSLSEPAAASHGGATLGTPDNPLSEIYVHDLYNTTDNIVADSVSTEGGQITPSLSIAGSTPSSTYISQPHDVDVQEGYAVTVGKGGTFAVVDLSERSNPTVAGGLDTFTNAQTVGIFGHYAFVGDDDGVHSVDVSEPTSPSVVSEVTGSGLGLDRINGWDRWGDYIVFANKNGSLVAIDVSDPTSLSHSGYIDTTTSGNGSVGGPHDVEILRGHAITVNQPDGESPKVAAYEIVDTDTNTLKETDDWSLTDTVDSGDMNGANRVVSEGRYAYVANNYSDTISVIDCQDFSALSQVLNVSTAAAAPDGLSLYGPYLVAGEDGGSSNGGIELFDKRNPTSLSSVTSITDATLDGAHEPTFLGDTIVVSAQSADAISTVNVGGVQMTGAEIGAADIDSLDVGDAATINKLNVTDALQLKGEALPSGGQSDYTLEVGTVDSDGTSVSAESGDTEGPFSFDTEFDSTPQVVTDMQQDNDGTAFTTAASSVSTTEFSVEVFNTDSSQSRTTGQTRYIAIDQS